MRWGAVVLVGCGRIGFSAQPDAGTTDTIDALPGMQLTRTFGERTGADVVGVTVDTFISNDPGEAALNYGATDELRSEADVPERVLIRFDVSSLPVNAQVISAAITVGVTQFDLDATITARPMLEDWTEGNGDGTSGAASFLERSAGTAWTTTGAGSPGSSGAVVGGGMPTGLGDLMIPLDPGTVQGWISSPSTNFGLVFFNSFTQSVRFASREHETAGLRPLLTVVYAR